MVEVSIIGAGGLTGKELLQILKHHPGFEITHITSNKTEGLYLSEVFRDLHFRKNLRFSRHEDSIPKGSQVFLAVPNEVSISMVPGLLDKGHKVVDLSGAYRLHNQEEFEKSYKLKHTSFSLMEEAVFGMPELFRNKIPGARLISNPGCYATAAILPLYLLGELRNHINGPVVADGKSGVSGAGGRTDEIAFSFTGTYENFRAYKILGHQHQPEMVEYSGHGAKNLEIIFTPHLLPLYRGILMTLVIRFDRELTKTDVENYRKACKSEKLVRYYEEPEEIELRKIQNTNYIDISCRFTGNTMVILSALDNLRKGAASQAIQNMNLLSGQEETTGLL